MVMCSVSRAIWTSTKAIIHCKAAYFRHPFQLLSNRVSPTSMWSVDVVSTVIQARFWSHCLLTTSIRSHSSTAQHSLRCASNRKLRFLTHYHPMEHVAFPWCLTLSDRALGVHWNEVYKTAIVQFAGIIRLNYTKSFSFSSLVVEIHQLSPKDTHQMCTCLCMPRD